MALKPKNEKTITKTYTNIDQTDTTLDFDGMVNKALPKNLNKYSGNQFKEKQTENAGRGPTKGNQDYKPRKVGPDATFDAYRPAPTDALPSNIKIKNPDYINGGAQVRTPGGTRPFEPQAEGNYKGDSDRINAGNKGGRPTRTFLK